MNKTIAILFLCWATSASADQPFPPGPYGSGSQLSLSPTGSYTVGSITASTVTSTQFFGGGSNLTGVVADALRSSTTIVNVSSATAPTAGQVLTAVGSSSATWQTPSGSGSILILDSTPTVGGAVAEAVIVTGLLTTDTILSVTQRIQGSATRTSLPFIGWNTVINGGLTAEWVADPGPNAVLRVAIKR